MCLYYRYSPVVIGKLQSDKFHVQNGLKQGDTLSPSLFNCVLEYTIRSFQDILERRKFRGRHQLLAYPDDVDTVGENIDTVKTKTEAYLDASKLVGLEVNQEKTKYMLMLRSRKLGQEHTIKIAWRSFEEVAKF
jgi:hypothetical protein